MKRSPIKRKLVPTNSRPADDLELRREYREKHKRCELLPILIEAGIEREMNGGKYILEGAKPDIHHILKSPRQRFDLWSNLVACCRTVHDWDDNGKAVELKLLCLELKRRKGELNIEELNKAAGATRPDAQPVISWLERVHSDHPWFEEVRMRLLVELTR